MLVSAPAKLTRGLRVTGVRADGFHEIDAEMVSLDFCDWLTIEAAEESGLSVSGPASAGVPEGPANLVIRALDACGRSASVRLVKRIPPGAGLGGGSSDAAAVLRWAGSTDPEVALGLGADVPYCVSGGRARVTGVGERVETLEFADLAFTLLLVPVHLATAAVYRAWDDLGGPTGVNGNDLEPAALAVEPTLATWRDAFGEATGERPRLAGSGSTWFVEGAFPGIEIAGAGVVVTRTVPSGWES